MSSDKTLKIQVRTLDAETRNFEVSDDITVEEFKIIILEEMGINIEAQRLIFCGKVLQDHRLLRECVSGFETCVLHLVPRAPPRPGSRRFRDAGRRFERLQPYDSSGSRSANEALRQENRRIMEISNSSQTRGRFLCIRRIIAEIRMLLFLWNYHLAGRRIRRSAAPYPSTSSNRSGSSENQMREEEINEAIVAMEPMPSYMLESSPHYQQHADHIVGIVERADNFAYGPRHGTQPVDTSPRQLAVMMEELELLQFHFARYRTMYIDLLMTADDYPHVQPSEEEKEFQSRAVELTRAIMHSFGHAYHLISDITFHISMPMPYLSSEIPTMHQGPPIHTVINVVQSNRPNVQGGSPAQVYVPADAVADGVAQAHEAAGGAENQGLENIYVGLGHSDAVEVVMSVEEVPQEAVAAAAAAGHLVSINPVPLQEDGQVYAAQLPWGTAPTAELIHSIVSAVVEHSIEGAVPQLHQQLLQQLQQQPQQPQQPQQAQPMQQQAQMLPLGHVPQRAQAQPMQQQAQMPPLGRVLQRAQAQPMQQQAQMPPLGRVPQQAQAQPMQQQAQMPPLGRVPQQAQAQLTAQAPSQQGQQQSPENERVHRATFATGSNSSYDRFLPCESVFSRNWATRNSNQQEQFEIMVRLRVDHLASQNIRHLQRRGCRLTNAQLIIMDNLLEGRSSRLAHVNAYLVTVARQCFMPGSLHPNFNEPYLIPREFNRVDVHIRSYIRQTLTEARVCVSSDPVQTITTHVLSRYTDFITSLMDMNSNNHIRFFMRPDVDLYRTLTNFFNNRLPRMLTSIMSTHREDMFPSQFYSMIGALHRDLLALILCCTNSERGLEAIHRHFVNQLTEGLDDDTSLYINTLSQEIFHRMNVTHAYASFHNLRMHLHLLSEYTVAQRIRSSLNADASETFSSLYSPRPSTSTLEPQMSPHLEQRRSQRYEMLSDTSDFLSTPEPMSSSWNTMRPGLISRPVSSSNMPPTQAPDPSPSPFTMSPSPTPEQFSIYMPDSPYYTSPPQTPEIILMQKIDSPTPMSPIQTPEPISTDRPESPTLVAPTQTLGTIPPTRPTDMPESPSLMVPAQTPGAIPSATPTDMPESPSLMVQAQTPGAIPSATPTDMPESPSLVTPPHIPGAMPSATPTDMPESPSLVTPPHIPGAMPSPRPTGRPMPPSFTPRAMPSARPTGRPMPPSFTPRAIPSARPTGRPITASMLLQLMTGSDSGPTAPTSCPHFMIDADEMNGAIPITDEFINSMADYMARIQVPLMTSVGTSTSTSRNMETQTTPTEESPTGSYSNLQDCDQENNQEENDEEEFLSANSDNIVVNSNNIGTNVDTGIRNVSQEENTVSSTVSVAVPEEPTPTEQQERAAPSVSGRHRHRRSRIRPMEPTQSTSEPERHRPEKVPPVLIIQHWDEEWVPVLSSDQSVLHSDQPPFSNAYLSGMPSRKRRCIRRSRPPTDLDGFINATFNEVSGRVSEGDAPSIRAAFREQIRQLARAHTAIINASPPDLYANTARFLHSSPERSETQRARC